ncbi:Chromatin assembly factor 1 subunit p50 [Sarracenia purpurea var. burkii]
MKLKWGEDNTLQNSNASLESAVSEIRPSMLLFLLLVKWGEDYIQHLICCCGFSDLKSGAFAGHKSEALGQGEAIAHNLRTMFGLKVPIVSIVIGEGGSGGALAIGCANKLFMLEMQFSMLQLASTEDLRSPKQTDVSSTHWSEYGLLTCRALIGQSKPSNEWLYAVSGFKPNVGL